LIEWGDIHPSQSMQASGVTLQALKVSHPQAARLQAAYQAVGLNQITVCEGPANLMATLATPLGFVTLQSKGI
jgi:hypothetical protein